jgi:hypothetical protein
MKSWGKIALYILVGILAVMQFFRPERNRGEEVSGDDLVAVLSVPPDLAEQLKNACYDCHSNRTRYPWYSQVAPVSWILDEHIREGKKELNFSTFGSLEKKKQIGLLSHICEVLEEGSMPLPGYVTMHRDAVFTEEEIAAMCDWTELAALKLLRD